MVNVFKFHLVVVAIVMTTVFSNLLFADNESDPPSRIEIEGERIKHGVDRSLSFFVDAYYNREFQTIELICYDLGCGVVSVYDSLGNLVCNSSFDRNDSTVFLEAPETTGLYNLVILSDVFYGEGVFYVN